MCVKGSTVDDVRKEYKKHSKQLEAYDRKPVVANNASYFTTLIILRLDHIDL